MTAYKSLVRGHLQPLLDAGLTQRQIADRLGIESPNFISMVLSDRYPSAVLPLARLPALSSLCGLNGTESLRLVNCLVTSEGGKGVVLDRPTLVWMLKCTALGLKEHRREH